MTARQMAGLPVIPVPAGVQFQRVDAGEVADRLVELALDTPAELVPDMDGPILRSPSVIIATNQNRPKCQEERATLRRPGEPVGVGDPDAARGGDDGENISSGASR